MYEEFFSEMAYNVIETSFAMMAESDAVALIVRSYTSGEKFGS